mgnify:CR=1 FL=1
MYILEDLWCECYSPEVKQSRRGSEYHRLAQGLAERRAELLPLLSADAKSILERFERTKDTLSAISEEDTFIEGFRMGALIVMDVLLKTA